MVWFALTDIQQQKPRTVRDTLGETLREMNEIRLADIMASIKLAALAITIQGGKMFSNLYREYGAKSYHKVKRPSVHRGFGLPNLIRRLLDHTGRRLANFMYSHLTCQGPHPSNTRKYN